MKRLFLFVPALFLLASLGCSDTLGVGHTFVPPTKAPITEPVDSVYEELTGAPQSAYGRFSFYETEFNEGYIRLPLDSPYRLFVFTDADGELAYRVYATREIMEDGTAANLEVGYLRAELRARPQPQSGETSYVILIDEGAGFVDTKAERFGKIEADPSRTNPRMPYVVATDGGLYYPATNGAAHFGAIPVDRLPNGDIVFTLPGGDSVVLANVYRYEQPTEELSIDPTPELSNRYPGYTAPTPAPTEPPTAEPSDEPTTEPYETPTAEPSAEPSETPAIEPSETPTVQPTAEPSETPQSTETPTVQPTAEPSETPQPTETPTVTETPAPTPTQEQSPAPAPSQTPDPVSAPSELP